MGFVWLFVAGAVPVLSVLESVANSTIGHGKLTAQATLSNAFVTFDPPHEGVSLLQVQVRRQEHDSKAIQAPGPMNVVTVTPGPMNVVTETPVQLNDDTVTTPVRQEQKVVWISSFPRSGSSVLLELLEQVDLDVFGLFEPCKPDQDRLQPWLAEKGCGALLAQLAQCNFTGVDWLWGWSNPYSTLNGADAGQYSVDGATSACQSAGMVVFKTISWGHNLTSEAMPFLEANPHVRMIDLIRDPRSIYGSFLNTWGFKNAMPLGNGQELFRFCDFMFDNLNKSHSRLTRVVYEQFVNDPLKTAMDIFSFIGLPSKLRVADVTKFVNDNFDNDDCDDDSYSNCRTNATQPVERYTMLPDETYTAFMKSDSCRTVALSYGYNPWYPFEADPNLPKWNELSAVWWSSAADVAGRVQSPF